MYSAKRTFLIALMAAIALATAAQHTSKGLSEIFSGPSEAGTADSVAEVALPDSLIMAQLRDSLVASRLNEANLRIEIETMRVHDREADSLRRDAMRRRIDSLRAVTPGAPVMVDGDTLFVLYAKNGGASAPVRAANAAGAIERVGKMLRQQPDSVYIEHTELVTDLMYGSDVLVSLSDLDGLWAGCPRDSLAVEMRGVVVEKLKEMKAEHGFWQVVKRTVLALLVLLGIVVLFKLINRGGRVLSAKVEKRCMERLKPFYVQNLELLDTRKQTRLVLFALKLVRWFFLLMVLVLSVPLLFSLFPQTEALAWKIIYFIWNPVSDIFKAVVAYIPNLFTIIVICIVIHYLVKMVRYLARELEAERLKIPGFYPDWALPTFYIIRFLLYAFMIAMIYPYLPGSNSGVFQGISVFLGLIVSLGSSTVIGNIIAGLVITYMRPFKMGDRIRLNDTTGSVIEKTPLVTRILTPKNEVVTVPNSFIMSSQTVNFSQSAREFGLIIHSEVTIGYDVPWRQVHKLLIEAALDTPGVVDDPKPFVLETSLSDYYPVYQVNAYIRDATAMAQIYSDLHQNIQDRFAEAGVEIMSPQYVATRDGNETTIPKSKE